MIARLQRLCTLLLCFLSVAGLMLGWQADRPGWALIATAAILGGYGTFLAIEFALMVSHPREASNPGPKRLELLRAMWGEFCFAPIVFCWRQPFWSRRWPDHLPAHAHGRRGLLLIHGLICNRGLWNPWLCRLRQLGIPYVALDLEPAFGSIDDYVPAIEQAIRRLEQATRLAPVVVAHSMGGLALRCWWANSADDHRIHRAVTIATPHHGTWLARFGATTNARQMRRGSNWLRALEQREPPARASRFVCFHGNCDQIVFPLSTATLQGADNRHLGGVAHVQMTARQEPWAEVLNALA
ncbi:MAG: alpha/beta fold hydrolase [Burkholderiales bacterium]|nr:alpha/beta fold hydrolase [Burkholderiales bacterium]MDE2394162.1 alpha/beta fold hydrolase [Burkholderiales bacterium]